MLGHRGVSAVAKENTVAAFIAAREAGAHGVELDVRRTADDRLVIHHDPEIEGIGVIRRLTWAELHEDAPDLATFEQAMEACGGMLVNIEIKNAPNQPDFDPDDTVAARVAAWVAETDAYESVLVSSFNPITVATVHSTDAAIATGWLIYTEIDPVGAVRLAAAAGHRAIHPFHPTMRDGVAAEVVASARENGLWVIAWTPEEPAEISSLAHAGIDAMIVDDPAAVLAVLAQN